MPTSRSTYSSLPIATAVKRARAEGEPSRRQPAVLGIDPQRPERAQLVVEVAKAFCDAERHPPGRCAAALRGLDHLRPSQRGMQPHLHSLVRLLQIGLPLQHAERVLDLLQAFVDQRERQPQRNRGDSQRAADIDIALARIAPVQSLPQIDDWAAVRLSQNLIGFDLPVPLRLLEEIAKIRRVLLSSRSCSAS